MLEGLYTVIKGIFYGIVKTFDVSYYFKLWSTEGANFGFFDWLFSILVFLVVVAVWVGIFFLIVSIDSDNSME